MQAELGRFRKTSRRLDDRVSDGAGASFSPAGSVPRYVRRRLGCGSGIFAAAFRNQEISSSACGAVRAGLPGRDDGGLSGGGTKSARAGPAFAGKIAAEGSA